MSVNAEMKPPKADSSLVLAFTIQWAMTWSLALAGIVGFLGLDDEPISPWSKAGALAAATVAFLLFGWLLHRTLNRYSLLHDRFSRYLLPGTWATTAFIILFLAFDSALAEDPIGFSALGGVLGWVGSTIALLLITGRVTVALIGAMFSAPIFAAALYVAVIFGYLAGSLWGMLPYAFNGALGGLAGGAAAGAMSGPLYAWLLTHSKVLKVEAAARS